MCFSVGFACSCALGAYVGVDGWAYAFAAVFAALGVTALFAGKRARKALAVGCLCLGIAAGLAWFRYYDGVKLADARDADGKTVNAQIVLTDYTWQTDYGCAGDGIITLHDSEYPVRFYLNSAQTRSPGDRVTGLFRLRLTTDGGGEDATFHRGYGIFLLAYPAGSTTAEQGSSAGIRSLPARIRRAMKTALSNCFSADTQAFARALLLGDKSLLDYETNTALRLSGISHIVAVSGLHISILFALVFRLVRKRRLGLLLIGVPVLVLFSAVTGFSASVVRACIMQCLMIAALAVRREYDPPTALGFAALVMLIGNPLVITSVSFQLSVAGVIGIFLWAGRITRWLEQPGRMGRCRGNGLIPRIKRGIAAGIGVTLSATVSTAPLVAYYFGTVSLVGVITNLLTLWAVHGCFEGLLLVCLLGQVSVPAARVVAKAVEAVIRYILLVSRTLSAFPLAAVYTESAYIVFWLALCYALLAVFLLMQKKRPAVLAACGVIGLCAALLLSWWEPLTDGMRVTVLDVGQGQCVLLQSCGKNYLTDCGGSYDMDAADLAAETLLSQGITHLDGLILTHADRDHCGGARYLLSRIPADVVMIPEAGDWESYLPEDAPVLIAERNITITVADARLTVFAPVMSGSSNENGISVLFQAQNCDTLITGDLSVRGEQLLLEREEIPDLELLIVGHHGAASSTGTALLRQTAPDAAVISVGRNNRYGHPAQAVLDRLAEAGCAVYATDELGTVIFRR